MNNQAPTLLSWSSGKDGAWALYVLQRSRHVEVTGLFTTINQVHGRVAMHAVPYHLVRAQARSIGLPLEELQIPHPCSNEEYERVMEQFLRQAKGKGIESIAFGDLFLEAVRRYREEKMKNTGISPIFPVWGTPTDVLSKALIDTGFRMLVTCIDPQAVPRELAGREYDKHFLEELPEGVDPCGENGEFHTFVFDGPIFKEPLAVECGQIVEREGFVFADVVQR